MAVQFSAGTTLYLYNGSYTSVANITSIGGVDLTSGDIDVTVLASTGYFKQFIAGWADGGVVALEALYDHNQCAALYAQFRTTNTWRITFPDNSRWDFSGYINAIKTDASMEDAVHMPFSIKITGVPTFTA